MAAEHAARRGRRCRRGARAGRRGGRGTAARPVPARKQRSCESALRATGSPASRASARTSGLRRARRAGSAGARASRGSARRACRSGPWPGRRPRRRRPSARARARSGRWPASRRRGGRRTSSIASRRTWPLQRTHGFGVRPAACSASHGSTTPARNSSRRSSVKCGRPMRCASARAPRTASAEQHERSPSFSGSRHSSSVTATRLARRPQQRGDGASRRRRSWRRACGRRSARAARRPAARRAERAVQRVGRQVGGVELAGAQPAELGGDRRAAHARRLEERRAAHELDRGARGGDRRPAARGLEPGVGDPVAVDRDRRCTRSPQAAPPAAPECDPAGTCPRPQGLLRCSANRSSGIRNQVCANPSQAPGPFHPMMGTQ